MGPWLAVLEAWLVKRLLESQTFYQGVRRVHKSIYRLRHGPLEGDEGGTNLERQGPGFGKHFWDEIQAQVGRKKPENPLEKSDPTRTTQSYHPTSNHSAQEQTTRQRSDHPPQPPKQGFMSHFMDELRSQARGRDKNP
ncbi:hypothetical protein QM012_007544 [Aureobasidium pullulans]|uniref:Uncharacterized protein n=1 Tax=Aureobasidium pullulans TaxID=5580 RepID=A0ABR0TP41_AURPU